MTSEFPYIIEPLWPLAVPIASLRFDPANCRKHPDDNLRDIRASLRTYGQRTPIVVNSATGIILKGNGTVRAARQLGWTHIAAVRVNDDPNTAAGYAIADNACALSAEWNTDALSAALASIQTDDAELNEMLSTLSSDWRAGLRERPESNSTAIFSSVFEIVATCQDEQDQRRLYEHLIQEGYPCRLIVS
jgi:hypothetical protein